MEVDEEISNVDVPTMFSMIKDHGYGLAKNRSVKDAQEELIKACMLENETHMYKELKTRQTAEYIELYTPEELLQDASIVTDAEFIALVEFFDKQFLFIGERHKDHSDMHFLYGHSANEYANTRAKNKMKWDGCYPENKEERKLCYCHTPAAISSIQLVLAAVRENRENNHGGMIDIFTESQISTAWRNASGDIRSTKISQPGLSEALYKHKSLNTNMLHLLAHGPSYNYITTRYHNWDFRSLSYATKVDRSNADIRRLYANMYISQQTSNTIQKSCICRVKGTDQLVMAEYNKIDTSHTHRGAFVKQWAVTSWHYEVAAAHKSEFNSNSNLENFWIPEDELELVYLNEEHVLIKYLLDPRYYTVEDKKHKYYDQGLINVYECHKPKKGDKVTYDILGNQNRSIVEITDVKNLDHNGHEDITIKYRQGEGWTEKTVKKRSLQILSEEEHSRINKAWREMCLDAHYAICIEDLQRHVDFQSHHAKFFRTAHRSHYKSLSKKEVAQVHSEFVFKYRTLLLYFMLDHDIDKFKNYKELLRSKTMYSHHIIEIVKLAKQKRANITDCEDVVYEKYWRPTLQAIKEKIKKREQKITLPFFPHGENQTEKISLVRRAFAVAYMYHNTFVRYSTEAVFLNNSIEGIAFNVMTDLTDYYTFVRMLSMNKNTPGETHLHASNREITNCIHVAGSYHSTNLTYAMVWLQHLLYVHYHPEKMPGRIVPANVYLRDRQAVVTAGQQTLHRLHRTMLNKHAAPRGSKQTVPLVDLSLLYRWGEFSSIHDYGYKWTGYIDLCLTEPQNAQQRFKTVKDIIHHMMHKKKSDTPSAYDQALQEIKTNGAALQKWPQYCNNLKFVKTAIQNDPLALRFASESLKDESDVVVSASKKNPLAVEFASERIKQFESDFVDQVILEIAHDVLQQSSVYAADSETIKVLPKGASHRQQFWEDVAIFQHLSPELKTNFDVIDEWLDACSEKHWGFNEWEVRRCYMDSYLHDHIRTWYEWYAELKDDGLRMQDIPWRRVNDILEKNTDCCATSRTFEAAYIETWYCDEERRWDLIMTAVKQNGLAYKFVSDVGISAEAKYRADAIAVAAVQQNGLALQWVEFYTSNYKIIVEQAVKQNGLALQHANHMKHVNPYADVIEIVETALKQNGMALEYANRDTETGPYGRPRYRYALVAVEQNGLALQFLNMISARTFPPGDLQRIFRTALGQNGLALKYVPEKMRKYELVLRAVQQNGLALEYVPNQLRAEYALVKTAVHQNGLALKFVNIDAIQDREKWTAIIRTAVQQNGLALQYVSKEYQQEYPTSQLYAVQQNGLALQHVNMDTLDVAANFIKKKVVTSALEQNGLALEYAPVLMQKDPEFVRIAVMQNGEALKFASSDLQKDEELVKIANAIIFCTNLTSRDGKIEKGEMYMVID